MIRIIRKNRVYFKYIMQKHWGISLAQLGMYCSGNYPDKFQNMVKKIVEGRLNFMEENRLRAVPRSIISTMVCKIAKYLDKI